MEPHNRKLLVRLFTLAIVLLLIALILFLNSMTVGAVIEGLTPPRMRAVEVTGPPQRLDQNWPADVSRKFHSISQGTRTLPLPLSWLLALEEPRPSLWSVPFVKSGLFMDNSYILRFGFIQGEKSELNPHGLPVGITTDAMQDLSGVNSITDAVGFTCAACHTAQVDLDGKSYLIDGGPASTDLGLLTESLGAALGQTLVSSKLPVFKGRFNRFAKHVLKDAYSEGRKLELAGELEAVVTTLASQPADVDVTEGFSRLDALNRIGNTTFALDTGRFENYVPIDAPVNYPHIWTASWFDWVQYDGSIMAPLIRNAGEALGVNAMLNVTAPKDQHRFASSINIDSLIWIESALSGPAPRPNKELEGLLSPPWPDDFPPVDQQKAEQGRGLYLARCQGCHLPPVDSDEFWDHFYTVEYFRKRIKYSVPDQLIAVEIIPNSQIGTDTAQGAVLEDRRVNTAGRVADGVNKAVPSLGLDTDICVVNPKAYEEPDVGYDDTPTGTSSTPGPVAGASIPRGGSLVDVRLSDSPNTLFALALGAIVQQTIETWFAQNYIPPHLQKKYEEGRPNCLRAGAGYKARPLNGIWSTAPFIHNGSVPTVYMMLSPPNERPKYVQLGSREFDPVNLGLKQPAPEHLDKLVERNSGDMYIDGYFMLDTSIPGNHNSGHEFSSRWQGPRELKQEYWENQPGGIIGWELSHDERMALIEFLKTQ